MNEQSVKASSLTTGPVIPTLLNFTFPFLLATMLQTLYGTVDTWTIGNFGSTAGLSAVSTGAQILTLVTYLSIGLSTGGTVLVGQCIGAKKYDRAAKIVGNVIIDFVVVSIVLMILLLLLFPLFLSALNLPSEALPEARRYMIICACGVPMIIGYNIVCALLRAMGDSKSPLIFVAVACVVNVIGDITLTGFFHLGAAGVAAATVTAQTVSFLFSLFFIMKKGLAFPFSRKNIRFLPDISRQIFRIGVPMAIQTMLINLSFMFITSIINSMGLTASAAMGIGDKITGITFLPQSSFTQALAVIVAQNIGAKQPKRAMDSVKAGILISLPIELLFLIICQVAPEFFPSLFTHKAEVIKLAGLYMKAYSIDGIMTSISFCLSGFLNGCGKTTFNMIQNLVSTFLGRVPATYILSRMHGTNLFLIGLAAPASTAITIVMVTIYIGCGFWKKGLYENEETNN